jgi:hypothetical protein
MSLNAMMNKEKTDDELNNCEGCLLIHQVL